MILTIDKCAEGKLFLQEFICDLMHLILVNDLIANCD